MKKLVIALTALAAFTGSAAAADLGARPYTKAPAPMAAVYNWTGFYIFGGGGGGLWSADSNVQTFPGAVALTRDVRHGERNRHRLDLVAEWGEQRAEERLAAAGREHGKPGYQRNGRVGQLRTLTALALERRAKHVSDGDAQERRPDVGPVVDVLLERATFTRRAATGAYERHGIDVEQKGDRRSRGRRFGIEYVRSPERLLEHLHTVRMLREQVS
jgi:hypothetical protein